MANKSIPAKMIAVAISEPGGPLVLKSERRDVPLPDGRTANRVMVETGLAWANRQGGGKYLRDEAIAGLERRARDRRLGLWSQPGAVAPWDWRWQCWDALENGRSTSIC